MLSKQNTLEDSKSIIQTKTLINIDNNKSDNAEDMGLWQSSVNINAKKINKNINEFKNNYYTKAQYKNQVF